MLQQQLLGGLAAAALSVTGLLAVTPAGATAGYGVNGGPGAHVVHPRSCWRYSYRIEQWVNFCRTYSYRYVPPQHVPVYPHYVPYRFSYGPYDNNGPYYGYEPSNGYQSSFGFSF